MRPPACVSCKWGTGTTCERPTNSVASKELDAKLKEMMAARSQQDTMWVLPSTGDSKSTNDYTAQSTSSLVTLQNKRK